MNMKSFTNACKLFVKTVSCIVPYAILLTLINYLLIGNYKANIGDDALSYFGHIRDVCYLLFSFYTFISYEFFRKSKDCSLEEVLQSYGFRGSIVTVGQTVSMLIGVSVTSINIAVYSIIGVRRIEFPKAFINDIVKMNILDILLLSLTGVFIGLLISKLKNRFSGYSIMAIALICASPAINDVLISLNDRNIPLYKLRDFLNFLPPDVNALSEKLYGFPVEKYRFALMSFWILLVIGIFIFIWMKNKTITKTVVCGILSIAILVNLIAYINRGSVVIAVNHPEAATQSVYQYYINEKPKQHDADFKIEIYDADFTINNQLKAKVNMKIGAQTEEDSYKFTLYHNYKIKNIYDGNNNKLKFVQDGDYFEVFKLNNKNANNIIVEYSGHSEAFYSNRQAVFLPGFFAFYPQPGYSTVYSLKKYNYISAKNEASAFNVNVNSGLKLASNLDGNGVDFSGTAQNLTLVGGYVEEEKIGEYDVVMYPLDTELPSVMEKILSSEYQELIEETENLFGKTENMSFAGKKIINIPYSLAFNSLLDEVYIYDDSVILNPYNISQNVFSIFDSCLPEIAGKQNLRRCFLTRVYNAANDKPLVLQSENGFTGISAEVSDTLALKFQELGVTYVAPIVYQYLKDESNTTDELEFLKSIKKN